MNWKIATLLEFLVYFSVLALMFFFVRWELALAIVYLNMFLFVNI